RSLELGSRERAPADRINFIARGHAKFVAILPTAQEHVATFAWPGELALHAPGEDGALIAIGRCSIVTFPPAPFFEIVSVDRNAAHNVWRELSAQIHALRHHAAM